MIMECESYYSATSRWLGPNSGHDVPYSGHGQNRDYYVARYGTFPLPEFNGKLQIYGISSLQY